VYAPLVAGVHQAAAGARLDRQVDADAQQLALLADAPHVLAVGDAVAHSPQLLALLRAEHVDQRHGSSSGVSPTGPAGRSGLAAARVPRAVLSSRSTTSGVLGDGPGRLVGGGCRLRSGAAVLQAASVPYAGVRHAACSGWSVAALPRRPSRAGFAPGNDVDRRAPPGRVRKHLSARPRPTRPVRPLSPP